MSLEAYFEKIGIEAGCDEAGRGCLAGPVVAAAVILPKDIVIPGLNDSKKLSEKKRNQLRPIIEELAIAYAVVAVGHTEIDEVNILNASFLAMHRSLDQLKTRPERILVDGNRFPTYQEIPHNCIIKGDGKYLSIAAASVLAKTYRDATMEQLHEEHPHYDWKKNKGYPTVFHRSMIAKHGASPYHRMTFKLLPD